MGISSASPTLNRKFESIGQIKRELVDLGEKGIFKYGSIYDLCGLLNTEDDFLVIVAISELEAEGLVKGIESKQYYDGKYQVPVLVSRYRYHKAKAPLKEEDLEFKGQLESGSTFFGKIKASIYSILNKDKER